jgi:hypothetical protein
VVGEEIRHGHGREAQNSNLKSQTKGQKEKGKKCKQGTKSDSGGYYECRRGDEKKGLTTDYTDYTDDTDDTDDTDGEGMKLALGIRALAARGKSHFPLESYIVSR